MSYTSNFNLNQRVSYLESVIASLTPVIPVNLANVLLQGNSAGASDIDLNNNDILQVDNIDLTTINGSAYPPVVPADDLSAVLTAGNSAGANDIDLNNNQLLNCSEITASADLLLNPVGSIDCNGKTLNLTGGEIHNCPLIHSQNNQNITIEAKGTGDFIVETNNINRLTISDSGAWTIQGGASYNNTTDTLTATTFSGNATSATTATTATNIAGGAGGSIPYQSASSTTALLANGSAGQVLTSNGTTLAPSWTTPAPTSQTLAQVLTTGNSAGTSDIDLNNNELLNVDNISVASPYKFSVISIFTDATARNTALPSPYLGQFCFLTGSNTLQFYNGGWLNYGQNLITPTITGFTLSVDYEIIYLDSGVNVVPSPVVGGFTIVRFYPTTTTSGTISVSSSVSITYLIVGGGGGGGGAIASVCNGGGGGGGGYLTGMNTLTGSVSYAVSVGGGGAGGSSASGIAGTASSLVVSTGTLTANGGGAGASNTNGGNGGCGGGGSANNSFGASTGGTGSQGGNGGSALFATGNYYSGGGGGAGGNGVGGGLRGDGGVGLANSITGTSIFYAGGGGGGSNDVSTNFALGGNGGGGNGGAGVPPPPNAYSLAVAGTDGLGGGGGGGGQGQASSVGFKGGAGVVIVRFSSYA